MSLLTQKRKKKIIADSIAKIKFISISTIIEGAPSTSVIIEAPNFTNVNFQMQQKNFYLLDALNYEGNIQKP